MTIQKKYTCNLCSQEINAIKLNSQYPEGWPLKWIGGRPSRPSIGDRLEECKWDEAPIHLCQACVIAIKQVANRLELAPINHSFN